MALFPAFIDLNKRNVLLVGGGEVAARKLEKLMIFKVKNLKIVAEKVSDEFKQICIKYDLNYAERRFERSDLANIDLFIVAADDLPLQKEIYEYSHEHNLLCNSVDSSDYCNFIFPALVTRGDLCVGINTNGKAPYLSKILRMKLDKILPLSLGSIVEEAHRFRDKLADKKSMEHEIKKHLEILLDKINF